MKKKLVEEIIITAAFLALTVLLCSLAYAIRGSVGWIAAFMFVAGACATITLSGIFNILCILGIAHGC